MATRVFMAIMMVMDRKLVFGLHNYGDDFGVSVIVINTSCSPLNTVSVIRGNDRV